jgi:hypothetical protein
MSEYRDSADDEDEPDPEFDEHMDDETVMLLRAMEGEALDRLVEQLKADIVEWESTGIVPDWQRKKYLGYDD